VWFYLTPSNDPMTAGDVEGQGARLRTPHGFMGQATARGDFLVPLPADLDPTRYGALVAWCETYNVVFGFAPLR
ncbi:MAG TPA: DM13 domain-containing protein, partial [Candidatus Thermoplasmatota archaeon]|nr:DM13 domain-containing protein [Candidatus Thermoplasmatota archaeon]